ncbi:MAG: twin-arginine translocase TatA/TatE family subunit [Winogradskyella sp.]|uniref:twin-arginine translocase TatA/TatE family subunit n=1 Tax=Winogradskyella sp. TaxID=1883156 RepID=UPI00385D680E
MSLYIVPLMIGPWQWVIIGLGILLLFGGKKIPELMKGLGSGIKEFKNASKDESKEIEEKE